MNSNFPSSSSAPQKDEASHVSPDLWSQQAQSVGSGASSSPKWEQSVLEKLAFSALSEQRATRRWKNFFRLAWLILIGAIVWAFMHQSATVASNNLQAHTAVVEIKGAIAADADASAENIVDAMRNALKEDGSKALVLLINSPGGSPVQAGIINDEIVRLKAQYKKPVYVVVEDTCASAAYYIAAAADAIYVDKASIVGSIGVLMDGFGFTGVMEKLGVERRLLTAGANKGFLDPFSPQTPEQRQYAENMLSEIHQQFINVVKAGRGNRLKLTPDMFSGLFWTGERAVDMGLADHLGNLDYVAREVVKAEEIIDYSHKENIAARLAKSFGASIGAGAVQALRATAGDLH